MRIRIHAGSLVVHQLEVFNTIGTGYGPVHTYNTDGGPVEKDPITGGWWWTNRQTGALWKLDRPPVVTEA